MKQKIIRKTLTGDWEEFEFDVKGRSFFVKNFTEAEIYVSFADESENVNDEAESFKINAGTGEEVYINGSVSKKEYFSNVLYVKGTGEVEVQVLGF